MTIENDITKISSYEKRTDLLSREKPEHISRLKRSSSSIIYPSKSGSPNIYLNGIVTILSHEDHQLRLLSSLKEKPELGVIYVEKVENYLRYRTISPAGIVVEDTLDICVETELTPEMLDSLKPIILEKTKEKEHSGDWGAYCRHLAHYAMTVGIKDYHDTLSNTESISSIPAIKDNHYDKLNLQSKASHYEVFDGDALGDLLLKSKNQMQDGETRNFLMFTHNHVLAITLRRKSGVTIVKFYDPNNTNMHMRAICKNDDAILDLTLRDFIGDLYDYYKCYKPITMVYYGKNEEKIQVSIQESMFYRENIVSLITSLIRINAYTHIAKTIKDMMNDTDNNLLSLSIHRILSACEQPNYRYDVFSLLALNNDTQQSLLFQLLQYGQHDLAESLIETIITSGRNLTGLQKFELLLAQTKAWPFLAAMTQTTEPSHLATAEWYLDIMARKLSGPGFIKLLSAPNPKGYSALEYALAKGHEPLVKAIVIAVINTPKLHIEQKMAFLSASHLSLLSHIVTNPELNKDAFGMRVVRFYLKTIIEQSTLSLSQKIKLLCHTEDTDIPSIATLAHQAGNEDIMIQLCKEAIADSTQLSLFAKDSIINAMLPMPPAQDKPSVPTDEPSICSNSATFFQTRAELKEPTDRQVRLAGLSVMGA